MQIHIRLVKAIFVYAVVMFELMTAVSVPVMAQPIAATEDGAIGLYDAKDFKLADGKCSECKALPQTLWYFQQDAVATPQTGNVENFSSTLAAQKDVASWLKENPDPAASLPVVWLGSRQVLQEARLSGDGKKLQETGSAGLPFEITPRISTNLSYWNEDTTRFFQKRPLRLRGEMQAGKFVARTVWPLDFRITPDTPLYRLENGESLKSLVQAEAGGAQGAFQARLLWERDTGAAKRAAGKAVMGIMLNGAQGDDDEAHGGHFGIVTGKFEADGNWSRWLVNNFYNLDSFSEKGIIAAVTPMDKYLMDLNNGQSYYRPSYMLVAVFRDARVSKLFQGAVNRVYNHFYRHDFVYDHSQDNCSGISIDTLRTLGWNIPERGVEGYLKAMGAYAYVGAKEFSLDKGRKIYDYLTTETTRLYPAVAFDAIGNDWLNMAQGNPSRTLTAYEKDMMQNIEAIWYVRIPQVPSSRAWGLAPIYSFDQYLKQAPEDQKQWKIIPVEPRPFPAEMRNGLALQQKSNFPVPLPVGVLLLGIVSAVIYIRRRRKLRKN